MTILVTGARGHVGRAVLAGLLREGADVRASSRNPREGDFPEGVAAVRADLADARTLPSALDGVDRVFLYAEPEAARDFAAAALEAGVQQVVVLSSASVVFPDAERNPIAARHLAVERTIDEAGLGRTFIRPAYFATNTLRWRSIRSDRVLRTAFPDAATSTVHERDIADVAVRALLDDGHRGAAYAILGAGTTTTREQVASIGDALGEHVRLETIELDEYRREQLATLPAPVVDRLLAAHGTVPPPPPDLAVDAVEAVVGRPPLTYAEWARDHADDFR